jgi:hypothetical protein
VAPAPVPAVVATAAAAAGLLAVPPSAPTWGHFGVAAARPDHNHAAAYPDVARFFAAGRPDLRVDWGTLEHLFCASFNATVGAERAFESQGLPFLRQQVVMVAKWAGVLDRLGAPATAGSPATGAGGSATFVPHGANGPLLFTLGELQPIVIWWTSMFVIVFFDN